MPLPGGMYWGPLQSRSSSEPPVLPYRMVLRARYAMSGTGIPYGVLPYRMVLRGGYATSGTGIPYGVRPYCMLLRARYAMSGTGIPYGATCLRGVWYWHTVC
eukprot:213009-Rhodomonas_salina.1